ncbi:MAG: hypothetical protein K1X88_35315 [Nannocystaceae bacterium]|nr:hypothetical protein [Nannocystaceae bacterium]
MGGSSGTDGGGSTGGGPTICDPDPADTECAACARMACCDELQACIGNLVCLCLLNCVVDGGLPEDCQTMCGENAVSQAVVDCGQTNCPACVP